MYRKTILKAALLLVCVICFPGVSCARRPIRALIVTGQNNHNWPVSHRALQAILQNSGLFAVDLAVSPPQGGDMDAFDPDFSAYRVVILDYNGDRWSASTERRFLDYVRDGGGVVLYHAADNAFPIGRNLIVLPLSEVGEAATSVPARTCTGRTEVW